MQARHFPTKLHAFALPLVRLHSIPRNTAITRNAPFPHAKRSIPSRMASGASDGAPAADPRAIYRAFAPSRKSVVLATASPSGDAHASVAPFVLDDARNIYVVSLPSLLARIAGVANTRSS